MAQPFLGKNLRIRLGEGANVVNFVGGTGAVTVSNEGTIQSDAFLGNDLLRRFGMTATYGVRFDRQIIRRTQNILRFVEFLARWENRTAADMGEMVLDWILNGVDDVLWLRTLVRGPQAVNHPRQDLASVSGALVAQEIWAGTGGTMETLSDTNLIPDATAQVEWKPVDNMGGLVMLTYARTGTQALQLQTKRGAGAWTANTKADAKLASTVSTVGSAVSLDAIVDDLQADDLVRVRYPTGTTAGNTWSGRVAFCAPESVR